MRAIVYLIIPLAALGGAPSFAEEDREEPRHRREEFREDRHEEGPRPPKEGFRGQPADGCEDDLRRYCERHPESKLAKLRKKMSEEQWKTFVARFRERAGPALEDLRRMPPEDKKKALKAYREMREKCRGKSEEARREWMRKRHPWLADRIDEVRRRVRERREEGRGERRDGGPRDPKEKEHDEHDRERRP